MALQLSNKTGLKYQAHQDGKSHEFARLFHYCCNRDVSLCFVAIKT